MLDGFTVSACILGWAWVFPGSTHPYCKPYVKNQIILIENHLPYLCKEYLSFLVSKPQNSSLFVTQCSPISKEFSMKSPNLLALFIYNGNFLLYIQGVHLKKDGFLLLTEAYVFSSMKSKCVWERVVSIFEKSIFQRNLFPLKHIDFCSNMTEDFSLKALV